MVEKSMGELFTVYNRKRFNDVSSEIFVEGVAYLVLSAASDSFNSSAA